MNAGDAKKLRQKRDGNTDTNARRRRAHRCPTRRFHVKAYREYGQRGESHERAVATRINGVVDDDRSAIGRDDTHRADL